MARLAIEPSAIAIERRDSDQGRNLLAVKASALGQTREQSCGRHFADAWHAAKQLGLLPQCWYLPDQRRQLFIDRRNLELKTTKRRTEAVTHNRQRKSAPIRLCRYHCTS
jgi:hypothetical protein